MFEALVCCFLSVDSCEYMWKDPKSQVTLPPKTLQPSEGGFYTGETKLCGLFLFHPN